MLTTDALLLRATDYREADRIVTLFTRDAGLVDAIARGARGSKRRFAGALEPYAVIRVELEARRGELHGLRRAEVTRPFPSILTDLARMEAGGAALALVRKAHAPGVADEALFEGVLAYLEALGRDGDPQRALLLAFAVRVLGLMGLAPQLAVCGRSGEPVPDGRSAYFDPQLGAVVSRKHGGGPFLLPGALRARLARMMEEDWIAPAALGWQPAELAVARAAIAAFVRLHVADDLGSRLFPQDR